MRRLAYLLANNNGLPGIKKDMEDFQSFLTGCSGGAWEAGEIVCRYNIRLSRLWGDLSLIKEGHYDYVLFYYSGHGDWKRETRLYINESDEYVLESYTAGLATRQLSIFDCCRVIPCIPSEKKIAATNEAFSNKVTLHNLARLRFDKLVMAAPEQGLSLYACELNQCAMATEDGSLYTQALLETAISKSVSCDVSAAGVHDDSCSVVSIKAAVLGHTQNPVRNPNGSDNVSLPFAIHSPQIALG